MDADSPSRLACLTAPPAPPEIDPTRSQPWIPDPADPTRRIPARVLLEVERSPYADIHVYQAGDVRFMTFGAIGSGPYRCQADFDTRRHDALDRDYVHAFVAALLANMRVRCALFIGLGGGSAVRLTKRLLPELHCEVVELDPGVIHVAQRYFGLGDFDDVVVHEGDGRAFVRRACAESRRYDVILLDAFDDDYAPVSLMTRECLAEMKSLLTPGGVICTNVFALGALKRRENATWAAVFGRFYELPCGGSNRLLIAGRDELLPRDELRGRALMLKPTLAEIGVDGGWLAQVLAEVEVDATAVPMSDTDPPEMLEALRRSALQPDATVEAVAEATVAAA